jgi:serine/threonine protein kinase
MIDRDEDRMNPNPSSSGRDDATAVSGQGLGPAPAPTDSHNASLTDASGPADVTVVRAAPSASTVNDMAAPNSFGKYDLLGELARGGMGVVYRARQHGLDRTVALKMILGTGVDHETAQRFLQEARAAAALDHPNVVPIYDTGEANGRPYFTMALIDGPNLRGFVDARGALPIPALVALFAQIVAGVAHAHRHGIIHRDLKPANVLIDRDGRPRVTDFGLAKRASADSQLTTTGQVLGTPQYMAPEQARGRPDQVGPPADVYALGAILYFLLAGRPPFLGESLTDLLLKVVSDAPVPPRILRPDVPAELEALCLRCLAKRPDDRFANAQALADELAPIAERCIGASSSLSPSLARVGLAQTNAGPVGTVPELRAVAESGSAMSNSLPAPAPRAPHPNRLPLFIGAGVAAVLLVAVIGYAATRGKDKKDDTAKHEPPAAAPTTTAPAGLPPGPPPGPPGPPPFPPPFVPPDVPPKKNPDPAPPVNDADKHVWPDATRADFGLKVELVAPTARKDGEGFIRMTAGSTMSVRLKAEKNCRVAVWVLDPSGHPTRLFPNDDDPDDRLTAGKERVVPGNDRYVLETTVTEGTGLERLRVIATTGEPPAYPSGTKVGRFTVYTGPERERLASTIRGVVIKKSTPGAPAGAEVAEVAEVELRFRVSK